MLLPISLVDIFQKLWLGYWTVLLVEFRCALCCMKSENMSPDFFDKFQESEFKVPSTAVCFRQIICRIVNAFIYKISNYYLVSCTYFLRRGVPGEWSSRGVTGKFQGRCRWVPTSGGVPLEFCWSSVGVSKEYLGSSEGALEEFQKGVPEEFQAGPSKCRRGPCLVPREFGESSGGVLGEFQGSSRGIPVP